MNNRDDLYLAQLLIEAGHNDRLYISVPGDPCLRPPEYAQDRRASTFEPRRDANQCLFAWERVVRDRRFHTVPSFVIASQPDREQGWTVRIEGTPLGAEKRFWQAAGWDELSARVSCLILVLEWLRVKVKG